MPAKPCRSCGFPPLSGHRLRPGKTKQPSRPLSPCLLWGGAQYRPPFCFPQATRGGGRTAVLKAPPSEDFPAVYQGPADHKALGDLRQTTRVRQESTEQTTPWGGLVFYDRPVAFWAPAGTEPLPAWKQIRTCWRGLLCFYKSHITMLLNDLSITVKVM